jgi:ribosomal-protein-alanine N-acetyltransferase
VIPTRGYPVVLTEGPVSLRPPRAKDAKAWQELQTRNRSWLSPWEATVPPQTPFLRRLPYREMVRRGRREAAAGRMMPFNIWYTEAGDVHDLNESRGAHEPQGSQGSQRTHGVQGVRRVHGAGSRMVGQLNVSGISWGSLCSAHIGYWVDERVAGRGIMPTALALAADHCFKAAGLHRVEVNIRPENGPSRRVAEKLGFREEGLRHAYLHIDGSWRDHLAYALIAEEVPEGVLNRWRAAQAARRL